MPTPARSTARGAPWGEIEITPEMINAGSAVLWGHPLTDNLSPGFCDDIARAVLECALRARRDQNAGGGKRGS
jgi:hypothetical protein